MKMKHQQQKTVMRRLEKKNRRLSQSEFVVPSEMVYLIGWCLGGHAGGKHLVERLNLAYTLGIYCWIVLTLISGCTPNIVHLAVKKYYDCTYTVALSCAGLHVVFFW